MAELTLSWYCIYVKSRHEFKVSERLSKLGIEVFLPAVEKLRKWKDRKKSLSNSRFFLDISLLTLKKSYELILRVLKTPGVVCFIKNALGEPEPVPEEQIIPLKKSNRKQSGNRPISILKGRAESKNKEWSSTGSNRDTQEQREKALSYFSDRYTSEVSKC